MRIGNANYDNLRDLPEVVPVFPLAGALLLPRSHLPLNIFEPRYLAMIDAALAGDRLIGMVQPTFDSDENADPCPLCAVGALGRIVSIQETGDGRYLLQLGGVCRFAIREELDSGTPFRTCSISAERFADDLAAPDDAAQDIDRVALIEAFQNYLDANDLKADWKSVRTASNEALVNTLAMMSPYGPREKQALLEAPDLKSRAATLVAITEIQLARQASDKPILN
ncbi:MAG: LON peptidase substrate-binding domain-containing protein [Acuticoccus sp.]